MPTPLETAVANYGHPQQVSKLLLASWEPATQASYNSYLQQWLVYCQSKTINNPYTATVDQAVQFLSRLYQEGKNYGSIAVARSALSAVLPSIGGKPLEKIP